MTSRISPGIILAVVLGAVSAVVFVVVGGIAHGYSVRSLAWLALSGALFGAVGAPLIEPKAFRYPTLWQIFCAVFGGLLMAGYLRASGGGYLLAVAMGLVAGYLAPYWVRHIQIP